MTDEAKPATKAEQDAMDTPQVFEEPTARVDNDSIVDKGPDRDYDPDYDYDQADSDEVLPL